METKSDRQKNDTNKNRSLNVSNCSIVHVLSGSFLV